MLDLSGRPKDMPVILRKKLPPPGAQLWITDVDGHRITCFATNTQGGSPPTLNSATADAPEPRTASAPPAPEGVAAASTRVWAARWTPA